MPEKQVDDRDRCERLNLTARTKRRLWSESGGYCQNPTCAEYLFPDDSDVDFAEMAHIIAASTGGSRDVPKAAMSEEERAHHANIAVLCANCHTQVDKDPDRFPADLMSKWKTRHQDILQQGFGTPSLANRADARGFISPLLDANRTIFETFGPDNSFSEERSQRWHHYASRTIVPNNATIARVLKCNSSLLTSEERTTAQLFDLHQTDFAARHVLNDFAAGTLRFPTAMNKMFEELE